MNRRHRFAEPTKEEEPAAMPRDPHKYDWDRPDKEPSLFAFWHRAAVWERAGWVVAAVGFVLLAWLVAKSGIVMGRAP
jgi:hypothetical protein